MYKKANYTTVASQQPLDQTTLQLQSLGMRIRKAVADGYSVSRSNGYATDFEIQQQQQQLTPQRRVPLPSHISQPPSLSYGNSSTLEGESFNERFLSQEPQLISNKRSREDDENDEYVQDEAISCSQVNNKEAPLEYFENKYGSLSFNEEF